MEYAFSFAPTTSWVASALTVGQMRCLQCGSHKDKVVDSRMSKDGTTIRRRRECLDCSYRYTTYEQIERTDLPPRVVTSHKPRSSFDNMPSEDCAVAGANVIAPVTMPSISAPQVPRMRKGLAMAILRSATTPLL